MLYRVAKSYVPVMCASAQVAMSSTCSTCSSIRLPTSLLDLQLWAGNEDDGLAGGPGDA